MSSPSDGNENASGRAAEYDDQSDLRFMARPYCRPRSRTDPVRDLAVETLVSTSRQGCAATTITSQEHQAIVGLCMRVRSVAEVSALLALPLGITRVLLADTIDLGLIRAHSRPCPPGSWADPALLERVLAGLRRL